MNRSVWIWIRSTNGDAGDDWEMDERNERVPSRAVLRPLCCKDILADMDGHGGSDRLDGGIGLIERRIHPFVGFFSADDVI